MNESPTPNMIEAARVLAGRVARYVLEREQEQEREQERCPHGGCRLCLPRPKRRRTGH